MKICKKILLLLAFVIATAAVNAQNSNLVSHTVAQGQTLYSISKLYNTTVDEIIKFNPGSAEKLSVGQKLIIPRNSAKKKTAMPSAPSRSLPLMLLPSTEEMMMHGEAVLRVNAESRLR